MPDSEARSIFPQILQALMEREHYSQVDIAEKLHVSKQTVSDWVNGKKFPRVDKMQQLADLFGVLMSDMYSGSVSPNETMLRIDEKRLISAYRAADPKYRAFALELLEDHPRKKDTPSSVG